MSRLKRIALFWVRFIGAAAVLGAGAGVVLGDPIIVAANLVLAAVVFAPPIVRGYLSSRAAA